MTTGKLWLLGLFAAAGVTFAVYAAVIVVAMVRGCAS